MRTVWPRMDRSPSNRAAPEIVAEDRNTLALRNLLFGPEGPAERGIHAEHREQVCRHRQRGNRLGLARRRQHREVGLHRQLFVGREVGDVFEHSVTPFPVEEVGRRRGRLRPVSKRIRLPELDEPARLSEWQRFEKNAVDDAEDRGVGADAERKRKGGHQRKRRPSGQHTERIPEILKQHVEAPLLFSQPERMGCRAAHATRRQPSAGSRERSGLRLPLTQPVCAVRRGHDERDAAEDPLHEKRTRLLSSRNRSTASSSARTPLAVRR